MLAEEFGFLQDSWVCHPGNAFNQAISICSVELHAKDSAFRIIPLERKCEAPLGTMYILFLYLQRELKSAWYNKTVLSSIFKLVPKYRCSHNNRGRASLDFVHWIFLGSVMHVEMCTQA